ncbi:response regulator [Actinomadura sp. 9N407]|uniref:response regulator n=1 Tax=Actinomadura sp. 9N407 TaxID=3375154 RepID=UPI003798FEA9
MIRVLLADDQPLVRAGLRALLESEPDIAPVGEAADGHEAVRMAAEMRPDVVLMDIRMPGMDGLTATRRIGTAARVLIVTTFDLDEYLYEALRAGASGFLVKDAEPAEIRHAVRVAARGDALLSPGVTRRLIEEFATRPVSGGLDDGRLAPLTRREREVLAKVAEGCPNERIGTLLSMSPATVKTHVNRMMAKLDVHDRAQLVVIAYETGLVRPGHSG